MDCPLDEWISILVAAENMVKVRRRGFVYLESSRFDTAQTLCDKINIDFMDWLNRYFDYDHYQ